MFVKTEIFSIWERDSPSLIFCGGLQFANDTDGRDNALILLFLFLQEDGEVLNDDLVFFAISLWVRFSTILLSTVKV